jgi:DNA polymerase III sliding clamp (beta) subunit (PCNA family)
MTEFYAQIPTPVFEATAGKNDNRPVLTGVLVEYVDDETARFSAADGYILATVEGPAVLPSNFGKVIVPGAFMKANYSRKRSASWENRIYFNDDDAPLSSTFTPDKVRMRTKDGDGWTESLLIQGAFPDYRKLIPWRDEGDRFEGWYIGFDPKLVGRLCKALDTDTFTVSITTPSSPGVMAPGENNAIGVIMPMFSNPGLTELTERVQNVAETRLARTRKELGQAEAKIRQLTADAAKVQVNA